MYPGQFTRAVLLLSAMVVVIVPLHANKRRFTVGDDIELTHFGDPYTAKIDPVIFSPNEKYFVVATERGLLAQNRPESTMRVFRTEDVHRLLHCRESSCKLFPIWTVSMSTYKNGPIITNIRWLNDSSGIAFLAKTEFGNDRLFLADLNTKQIVALTLKRQRVIAFDIRDRKHFVYSVRSPVIEKRIKDESEAKSIVGTGRSLWELLFPTEAPTDLNELWAVVKGHRFRVESKSSRRALSFNSLGYSRPLELSPDGASVVTAMTVSTVPPEWETQYPPPLPSAAYRIRAGHQDLDASLGYNSVSEYVSINLVTGNIRRLTRAPVGFGIGGWMNAMGRATWSRDGRFLALSNTFLPPKDHAQKGDRNRPCVVVVDLKTEQIACLESLKGLSKTGRGSEDGAHFIYNVYFVDGRDDEVRIEYYALDSSGRKESVTYKRAADGSWGASAPLNGWASKGSGALEISVKQGLNDPPLLIATDGLTGTSRIILDPNPQLKDIDLGEASVYRWKDRNGHEWVGGLYKPSDFVLGRRYPLVLQTHGFSEDEFRPYGAFPSGMAARELATAGILVLQAPDGALSNDTEEAPRIVRAYEDAAQQLVAEGTVDADRIGIVGFSRTCYYVMEALTNSRLHFRAATITDGVNEGYLQYLMWVGDGGLQHEYEMDGIIGAPPFGEGLQQWLQRSPEFKMDHVTTPLLVVALHRLDILFMWEPYATLRYLKRPVDLIMLNANEHVLTNPAERMVSQGGIVDWFRFWLQGYEDPDTAKTEQYKRWRELRKLQNETEKKAAIDAIPVSH